MKRSRRYLPPTVGRIPALQVPAALGPDSGRRPPRDGRSRGAHRIGTQAATGIRRIDGRGPRRCDGGPLRLGEDPIREIHRQEIEAINGYAPVMRAMSAGDNETAAALLRALGDQPSMAVMPDDAAYRRWLRFACEPVYVEKVRLYFDSAWKEAIRRYNAFDVPHGTETPLSSREKRCHVLWPAAIGNRQTAKDEDRSQLHKEEANDHDLSRRKTAKTPPPSGSDPTGSSQRLVEE